MAHQHQQQQQHPTPSQVTENEDMRMLLSQARIIDELEATLPG